MNKKKKELLQKEFKTKNYAKILIIYLPKLKQNKLKINKTLNIFLKTYNLSKTNIIIDYYQEDKPKWIFQLYIKNNNEYTLLRTDKYEGVFKI